MKSFEELLVQLEAKKAVAAASAARGANKAGLLAEGDAKRLCPVDTGRLRNSIHTELVLTESGGEAHVGSNVEYAAYLEYGTGQRGDSSVEHRQDWLGRPPKPYLRPAVEINRDNIARIIADEMRKGLV